MVVSSFTRMVSEAQCCGRLHHRDSHSFPLLLSRCAHRGYLPSTPRYAQITFLFMKQIFTELCLITIVVDNVTSVGPIEICEFTVATKLIVKSVKYECIFDTERHQSSLIILCSVC